MTMTPEFFPDTQLLSTSDRPLFLLDSGLNCIFSGNSELLAEGESLIPKLRRQIELPLLSCCEEIIYTNHHFCCVELIPVKISEQKNGVLCRFITSAHAAEIAMKTEIASDLTVMRSKTEYYTNDILRCIRSLSENADIKTKQYISNAEYDLVMLTAMLQKRFEYINCITNSEQHTLFDIDKLCRELITRCNAMTARCGRHIEYLSEAKSSYIRADSRQAITALVHALQNSLLYSPIDSNPILTVLNSEDSVIITLKNPHSGYTAESSAEKHTDTPLAHHMGCGLSVIKIFAEKANGTYRFELDDEFAKDISEFDTFAEYRDDVKLTHITKISFRKSCSKFFLQLF